MRSSAAPPLPPPGDARLLSGVRTIGGEPARLPGIDAPTLCCAGYASGAWYTGPDHDVLRGSSRRSEPPLLPPTAECGGGLERRDAGCYWCCGWMGVMPKARRTWCAMCCDVVRNVLLLLLRFTGRGRRGACPVQRRGRTRARGAHGVLSQDGMGEARGTASAATRPARQLGCWQLGG